MRDIKHHRDLNAIMHEDVKRRNARQAAEDAALASMGTGYVPEGVDPYHYSRSIRGRFTNGQGERKVHAAQASDNCWNRGMRGKTAGTAIPFDNTATEATVMVTLPNGTQEIRTARSFRADSIAVKQEKHAQARKATKTSDATMTYSDRLARFGAVNETY